jgi:hypothetical protein
LSLLLFCRLATELGSVAHTRNEKAGDDKGAVVPRGTEPVVNDVSVALAEAEHRRRLMQAEVEREGLQREVGILRAEGRRLQARTGTLEEHCCYTVVLLLSRCCCTVVTLLLHFCQTVDTLLIHC